MRHAVERIALPRKAEPQHGRKVFTLQTLPARTVIVAELAIRRE